MSLIVMNCPEMLMEVDADTYLEGEVLKEGSAANRAAKCTAKGDLALFVVVETIIDPKTGQAVPSAVGDKIRVFKLGTKATVHVKSVTGQTYTPGAPIYLSTTQGQVTATDLKSARAIGHYPRNMAAMTTTIAGQLVPCYLDVEPGAELTPAE